MITLEKPGGARFLAYRGRTFEFDAETRECSVEDDSLARSLAREHNEVRIVEVVGDHPTLDEAEDDYHAARRLANAHDLSSAGTHPEILERLYAELEPEDEPGEGD